MHCQHGFARDNNNCEICECNPAPGITTTIILLKASLYAMVPISIDINFDINTYQYILKNTHY